MAHFINHLEVHMEVKRCWRLPCKIGLFFFLSSFVEVIISHHFTLIAWGDWRPITVVFFPFLISFLFTDSKFLYAFSFLSNKPRKCFFFSFYSRIVFLFSFHSILFSSKFFPNSVFFFLIRNTLFNLNFEMVGKHE